MAPLGGSRHGGVRQARDGQVCSGTASLGIAWRGLGRRRPARIGLSMYGSVRQREARRGMAGPVGLVLAGHWLVAARQVEAGSAILCSACPVSAWSRQARPRVFRLGPSRQNVFRRRPAGGAVQGKSRSVAARLSYARLCPLLGMSWPGRHGSSLDRRFKSRQGHSRLGWSRPWQAWWASPGVSLIGSSPQVRGIGRRGP